MGRCPLEARKRLALTDRAFEYKVHPLPRSFDEAALRQRFGQSSVAWILLIQDVVGRDARREASGADYLETSRELAHED